MISSDFCRALVSDDENNQRATPDAFEILHLIVDKRLGARRLTVVDATNARLRDRKPLIAMARRHRAPTVAIVFNLPARTCLIRNAQRLDRRVEPDVIRRHAHNVRLALDTLGREGIRRRYILHSAKAIDEAVIRRPK